MLHNEEERIFEPEKELFCDTLRNHVDLASRCFGMASDSL